MKLSASNIAWTSIDDEFFYKFLSENGFQGIELAPTRIFPENPYSNLDAAREYKKRLFEFYSLEISSIQSIFYGRNENLFNSDREYQLLLDYTKQAVNFAAALNCPNLVFGCPKNRNTNSMDDYKKAIHFFHEVGEYAFSMNTTISLEANPVIYHTNFINTTSEAFELVQTVDSNGFKVNLDLGTMIFNHESVEPIKEYVPYINHIHISEPELTPILERDFYSELYKILKNNYEKYISLEMKSQSDIHIVLKSMNYMKEIFQ